MKTVAIFLSIGTAILALGAPSAGVQSQDNPALGEIKTATIEAVYFKGDFPEILKHGGLPTMNAAIQIKEWIEGRDYHQLREIYQHFGHRFALRPEHGPEIKMELLNSNFSSTGDSDNFVYLGARLEPEEWAKLRQGVQYKVVPLDKADIYKWKVDEGVTATLR